MIDQKIFAKLERQPAFDKLNLAIVFGLSQVDLILCALKCSSFNFLLIVKCSPSEQYRIMCDYEIPSNIQIIFDKGGLREKFVKISPEIISEKERGF